MGRKQSRHRDGRAVQALTATTGCSRYATDTHPFSALATVPRPSLSSSTLHRPTAQAKNHNIPNLATLALQEGGNHDMGTEWHPFGGFEATCGTMFNVAQDAWSREMWLAGSSHVDGGAGRGLIALHIQHRKDVEDAHSPFDSAPLWPFP